jgi:hypothetical protein
MIVIAGFEPIATFELRPSNTTKTGGKTLICPTPYAVRMALLDRMIRSSGLDYGRERFPIIRDMGLAIQPPVVIAVNRTFQKILRPPFSENGWTSTIAMREFCVPSGVLGIAFAIPAAFAAELVSAVAAVNYFGQRGSFFQLTDVGEAPAIPAGFVDVTRPTTGLQLGYLQRMDDMLPDATFDDVSTFNPRSKGGRHAYNVVFPYKLDHSAFNHSVWRREVNP